MHDLLIWIVTFTVTIFGVWLYYRLGNTTTVKNSEGWGEPDIVMLKQLFDKAVQEYGDSTVASKTEVAVNDVLIAAWNMALGNQRVTLFEKEFEFPKGLTHEQKIQAEMLSHVLEWYLDKELEDGLY
jgi:hypothetical protein